MYGLPQAGIIAQELLAKRLKDHGYSQSETTPGLWKHEWRPIMFSLVVDDFGVKYVGEEHADHLLKTIQKYYQCSVETVLSLYLCGRDLKNTPTVGYEPVVTRGSPYPLLMPDT